METNTEDQEGLMLPNNGVDYSKKSRNPSFCVTNHSLKGVQDGDCISNVMSDAHASDACITYDQKLQSRNKHISNIENVVDSISCESSSISSCLLMESKNHDEADLGSHTVIDAMAHSCSSEGDTQLVTANSEDLEVTDEPSLNNVPPSSRNGLLSTRDSPRSRTGCQQAIHHVCIGIRDIAQHGSSLNESAIHSCNVECSHLNQVGQCIIDLEQGQARVHVVQTEARIEEENQPPSYADVCKTNVYLTETSSTSFVVALAMSNNASNSGICSNGPPSYREATGNGRYLEDAPPTYHSLFTESMLRSMHPFSGSDSVTAEGDSWLPRNKAFVRVAVMFLSFLLLLFLIGVILGLPLCMIIIGVANIHGCPKHPRIPIYLIVLGIFQLLECCGRLGYYLYRASVSMGIERHKNKDPLIYFMVVWFVVGSMWVYQASPPCFACSQSQMAPVQNISALNISLVKLSDPFMNEASLNGTNANITLTQSMTPNAASRQNADKFCEPIVYHFSFWLVTVYYGIVGFLCLIVIMDAIVRIVTKCCCRRCQR